MKKKKLKRQRNFAKFDPIEPPKPTILKTQPRLLNVCKVYNVSSATLIDFLKGLGYKNLSNTTLLDDNALSVIAKTFKSDKAAKDKIRGVTSVTFMSHENNSPKMQKANPDSSTSETYNQKILYLESNFFDKLKNKVFYKTLPDIDSHFSDFEAVNLCSKMSSSYTRSLCKQFDNSKTKSPFVIYQIHFIANKALNLFGGKILSFIYNLRKLRFKNQTAKEITTYSKVIPDFPIISFTSKDASFKISFFLKQDKAASQLKADVRIYETSGHQEIGHIDSDGNAILKLEKYKPQLNLFYEAIRDNDFKIYSGIETGICDVCGYKLTTPVSLRIGIGPICAKNLNIDTSIYNYR